MWLGSCMRAYYIPCWRPLWTCHLWKLAQSIYDVQLSSDFNMLETLRLSQQVSWPQKLVIYGPRPDLWLLKLWPQILLKSQLFAVCQQGSIKWLLGNDNFYSNPVIYARRGKEPSTPWLWASYNLFYGTPYQYYNFLHWHHHEMFSLLLIILI